MVHIDRISLLDFPSLLSPLANTGDAVTLWRTLRLDGILNKGPALVACLIGGGESRIVRLSSNSCHLGPGENTRHKVVGVFDVFGGAYMQRILPDARRHYTPVERNIATFERGRYPCQ